MGKALPPQALTDDTVGRVLDRRHEMGAMTRFTACAVQAVPWCSLARRHGPFEKTSCRVWGEDQRSERQALPCRLTYGDRKDQRPDLQPCVRSTLGGDRAVPIWGQPEDGKASDKTLHATL